jgi:hypothetical protein
MLYCVSRWLHFSKWLYGRSTSTVCSRSNCDVISSADCRFGPAKAHMSAARTKDQVGKVFAMRMGPPHLPADSQRRGRWLRSGLGVLGGVFALVIPDNMKAIVDKADATEPRLNDASVTIPRLAG